LRRRSRTGIAVRDQIQIDISQRRENPQNWALVASLHMPTCVAALVVSQFVGRLSGRLRWWLRALHAAAEKDYPARSTPQTGLRPQAAKYVRGCFDRQNFEATLGLSSNTVIALFLHVRCCFQGLGSSCAARARPNPSLNRTRYGGLSWPGCRYTVHFLHPGQAIPPQRPG
jgi:hypothetical protein